MIVRKLEDARRGPRRIVTPNWESTRLLLAGDQMGFSFHITTLYPGTENPMWYKHHVEAVYCISGRGELYDEATGASYVIEPGVMYALDQHDRHVLKVHEELTCACVFNPPLNGKEVHDEEGAYRLDAEAVEGE